MNALVTACVRDDHLMKQRLGSAQDDAVAATNAHGCAGAVDGLGGVFDLEEAAVGRKRRGRQVVARAGGCHGDDKKEGSARG